MTINRLYDAFYAVLFTWALLIFGLGSAAAHQSPSQAAKSQDDVHQLWATNIKPIFARPVASSSGAYYAGEMLMVPVHAAFKYNDEEWEKEFAEYFQHFMQSHDQLTDVLLSRLQFLYVGSEFILLAKQSGHADLIPAGLPDLLYSEVRTAWQIKPAIQWEHAPFSGGLRERILWRLNTHNVAKSYFRAIMDDDLFLFAIAADLRSYGGNDSQQKAWRPLLNDVLTIAHRVYEQEITPSPFGGWILQPGVWTDHPDFQYAGNGRAQAGIQKAPVRNITWDSSHSLRFPMWLTSMMTAYSPGSDWNVFYAKLRTGLDKQFFTKVAVRPSTESPCFRVTNYMDGSNGVYRWGYPELGKDTGYGPYQISGGMLLGWWAFLDTGQSKTWYRDLAAQYPWPQQCIELYLGPNQNNVPYAQKDLDPKSPAMRLRYLLVKLASDL